LSSEDVSSVYFGGNFNNTAITTDSLVTVSVTTAATRASLTGSVTFTTATDTVAAGTFAINGRSFSTTSQNTAMDVVNMINAASSATGVTADFEAGSGIVLRATRYGTIGNFTLSDADGVLNAAGTASATGTNALASVIIDSNGATAGGLATVTFTGGRMGHTGLVLTDTQGNVIGLTEGGNAATSAFTAAFLKVGSTQFQIGANANQTVSMSIGNFASTELGRSVVAGMSLGSLDITSAAGATDAIRVIDAAIDEITRSRGELGSFQRNLLESNIRALGVARENLAATESAIRDSDVSAEMTNFTRIQILQQAGIAVLAQANIAPQSVLALLQG
jgi:flagellin